MNEMTSPTAIRAGAAKITSRVAPHLAYTASAPARRIGSPIRISPRALAVALLLGALLPLADGAHASAASRPVSSPAQPVIVSAPARVDAGLATTGVGTPILEDVATKRQEILRFVASTHALPAASVIPTVAGAVPQDEALLVLQSLADEDVERIHDALPIVHHWQTIQQRMAAGPESLGIDSQPQVRGQRTYTPSQAAELEAFRTDLDEVFVMRQSWAPLVGGADSSYLDYIDDGRRLVQDATLEDLEGLQDALTWIPDWQATLAPDLMALVGPGGSGTLGQPRPGADQQPDSAQPLVTDGQCSDADRTRDVLPLVIAAGVVAGTAAIEDFAANFFTKDIKICVGIFGVTVCVDFPNPIFFILKILEFASNRVVDGLNAAILVAGVCTSIDHWNLTVDHRDNFLLNAQAILASLIARHNELITRTEKIDFANREAWKLELQLAIEENLLAPLPDPSGIDENRMSLFQLTDTVCFNPDELLPTSVPALPTPALATPSSANAPPPALDALPTPQAPVPLTDRREQCGIELVQRIVDEAIKLNKDAGNEIHDAEENFAAANVHFTARRYKEAYLRYRQAYMAAVQPDAEPRRLFDDTADH